MTQLSPQNLFRTLEPALLSGGQNSEYSCVGRMFLGPLVATERRNQGSECLNLCLHTMGSTHSQLLWVVSNHVSSALYKSPHLVLTIPWVDTFNLTLQRLKVWGRKLVLGRGTPLVIGKRTETFVRQDNIEYHFLGSSMWCTLKIFYSGNERWLSG